MGGCGCIGEGDREMCVMAVKRLLCDPTLSLSTTGQEWSSLSTTGKQWRQYSTELLHRLWVSETSRAVSNTTTSCDGREFLTLLLIVEIYSFDKIHLKKCLLFILCATCYF